MKCGVIFVSCVRGYGMSMSTMSLMRPGRALMMMTRCARMIASSTSWVMKKQVLRFFSQVSSSSVCSCVRVCASSAPNGSSISSTSGSAA